MPSAHISAMKASKSRAEAVFAIHKVGPSSELNISTTSGTPSLNDAIKSDLLAHVA
jgi:hypothetical protein